MPRKYLSMLLIVVVLISLLPSGTYADTGTSNLTIRIFDQSDPAKNMGGAEVTITGESYSKTVILPLSGGAAEFMGVPNGNYALSIKLQGYSNPPRNINVSGQQFAEIGMVPLPSWSTPSAAPSPSATPAATPSPTPAPTPKPRPVMKPKPVSEIMNTDKAIVLNGLGLFTGTDQGYKLEEPLLRVQGAVFLVKLLGKEEDVKTKNYTHPFTDVPAWADSYVGYLYQNKISSGIGGGKFGSMNLMTADEYMAFVLRALGYVDKGYTLDNIMLYAWMTGIIDNDEYNKYKAGGTFYRDDAILFSYNSLRTRAFTPPEQHKFFAQQLNERGVVSKDLFVKYGILPESYFSPGWEAEIGPYGYNRNPGGDWEVYRDFFDVVDLGTINGAKSSTEIFKISRAVYVCGMKAGKDMMISYENGIAISYFTHAWAISDSLKTEADIIDYLNGQEAIPVNFQYTGKSEYYEYYGTHISYIVMCEKTREGLKYYLVLKPKYKFNFY